MNEKTEPDNPKTENEQTDDRSFSFSGRAEYTPALILEQLIQIRGLLGVSFTLQLELLSHLTGNDPEATRLDYVQRLGDLLLEYSREAQESIQRQPPIE